MRFLLTLIALLLPLAALPQGTTPTFQVKTVADLIATPIPSVNNRLTALVTGRLTENDGAGGVFYYQASSAATTNLGTVFKPAASGGQWLREYSGDLDLRWFGATTNGADNRNILQAALNESQGKTLVIPAGDYRIVGTMPIYIGTASMRGAGGRFWISLPTGYVNPNTPVTQPYTALNQLDRNGAYVTWFYPGAPDYSWNGKTEIFTGASGSILENLWIDFGWGSVSTPAGVIPITGVRSDIDEFTYYQGFNDSANTTWRGCHFQNAPGAYIEVGHDLTVQGCDFGEFGDHVFYIGQDAGSTQKNFKFQGNTIACSRAQVGFIGQASYVFQSFRDALKFRGCGNTLIQDNQVNDLNNLITGIHLEVNDAQPGDVDRVNLQNNNFKGGTFLDCISARGNGGAGTNDYRFRNVYVEGNVASVSSCAVRFRAACDTFGIIGNDFYGSGSILQMAGHPRWTNAIKSMVISRNHLSTTTTPAIWLSGSVRDLAFTKNDLFNTGAPSTTSGSVIWADNSFDLDGLVPVDALPVNIGYLLIEGNNADNFYSWFYDSGAVAYSAGTTYGFATVNGINEYSVVSFGGALYRNTVTTTGVAPNVANWAAYTRATNSLVLRSNIRTCSSANAPGSNSAYLAYLAGPVAMLRMTYLPQHSGNINYNSLGEPVNYSFANVSDIEMDASSFYKILKTTTLDSWGNSGALNGYNSMTPRDDFSFLKGGALDQYLFFPHDTNSGPLYVDYFPFTTNSAPRYVRVFRTTNDTFGGLTEGIMLSGDGTVYFGRGTNGPSLSAGDVDPNGSFSRGPGSIFLRSSGGTNTSLYVKQNGATNSSGWTPLQGSAPLGSGFSHVTGGLWDTSARAVNLSTADVTGNLGISHFNSGTDANATNYWRGDGVWAPASSLSTNGGTVTSVGMSVPAFLSVAGSPITSSGTLAVTLSGTKLPLANESSPTGSGFAHVTTGAWDAAARNSVLASADFSNQGTTTTLLHGNPAGNPSWGQVNLAAEVTGNLAVSHLDSGTSASGTTFWSGDGTWKTAAGTFTPPTGDGAVTVTGGIVDAAASPFQLDFNSSPASGGIIKSDLPDIKGAIHLYQATPGVGGDGAYIGFEAGFGDDFILRQEDPLGGFRFFTAGVGGGEIMNIDIPGNIKVKHIGGELSGAPSIAVGPAAGGSPTVALDANANDMSMTVTLGVGSAPTANATLFTITFSTPYVIAPHITFSASSASAAGLTTTAPFVDPANITTTQFVFTSNAVAMVGGFYKWTFHVLN